MRKRISLGWMALVMTMLGLVFGCTQSANNYNINDTIITMHFSPGLIDLPAYTVTIYGNGTVIYEVSGSAVQISQISKDRVKELIDEFYKIDYFSLKDEYTFEVLDASTTTTSITIDGQKKQVINYYGAPQKLNDLEEKIKNIAGVYEHLALYSENQRKKYLVIEKLSYDLWDIAKKVLETKENGQDPSQLSTDLYKIDNQGRIEVYITLTIVQNEVLDRLRNMGVKLDLENEYYDEGSFDYLVSGWMPAESLESVAGLESVKKIDFAEYAHTVGVNEQGQLLEENKTQRVVVEFNEGGIVRLRNERLVSLSGEDLSDFYNVMDNYEGVQIERYWSRSEEDLDNERKELEEKTGKDLPDLNSFYVVTIDNIDITSLLSLLEELKSLSIMAEAYELPVVVPA